METYSNMNAKIESNKQPLSLHEIKHIFSGGIHFLGIKYTEDDMVLEVNKLV